MVSSQRAFQGQINILQTVLQICILRITVWYKFVGSHEKYISCECVCNNYSLKDTRKKNFSNHRESILLQVLISTHDTLSVFLHIF